MAVTFKKLAYEADVITKALLTTKGDIVYASAANTPARLGIGSNTQLLQVSTDVPAWASFPLSKGGVVYASAGIPNSALNLIVWRAPFSCTVTKVYGYRVGGTGATINARLNGTSNHLSSALSLTSADTWTDGGAVQNTAYVAGDKLEIMIVSTAGTVTQIAIQVSFTMP